ncbi:MAG: thioredoxin domain-containing protein [Candidatus Peribacteraceae bacterium]|nr:thioredoxin domain-containing protein [Candidatus Peribacteraceae bacterium]
MKSQLPPSMQQQLPSPSAGRHWIIALAALVLMIVIGVSLQLRFTKMPQEEPVPKTVPVTTPPLTELEEVREYTGGRPLPPVSQNESAGTVDTAQEHTRGDPNARISIVEYANMTDEYARLIHADLRQFVEDNPDVNWVFRHYPIAQQELDYPAAYISECVYRDAGDTAFWSYIDTVYSAKPEIPDYALVLAEPLVSDIGAVERCYETLAVENDVKDDKRLAITQGKVQVIPTFFFVDHTTGQERVVQGIDTMDFFQAIVDEMLRVQP